MGAQLEFRLARGEDAPRLAAMSRDLIERGLGWSWTADRVREKIRCPNNIVVVAQAGGELLGFAIMFVGFEEARLNLLAVSPRHRKRGIGRQLVTWLEQSALVAGTSIVYLEVRAGERGVQRFYERLGYRKVQHVPGYYAGRESAYRMARDLWDTSPQSSTT